MTSRLSTSSTRRLSRSFTTVKVTTYNVLSTNLAEPTYFTHCTPENLDGKNRLDRLMEKLSDEIEDDSIICLQEVSLTAMGVLHPFFSDNGYHLITAQYGNKWNGNMGVGIAVPLEKYKIEHVDVCRIAETKKQPRKPELNFFVRLFTVFILTPLVSLLRSWKLLKPKDIDPFEEALRRYNQMVSVRLVPNVTNKKSVNGNRSFVVSTYHMPCMFQCPPVMTIHAALSAQYAHKYANGLPYVLAGDFNFKPQDSVYDLITKGGMSTEDPAHPNIDPTDNWKVTVPPLKSAYKEYNNKEPSFTNWSQTKDDPEFIDTLDYIFYSPEFKVISTLLLPERHQLPSGPLPIETEPSDHLLLSATLALPPATE